MSIVDVDVYDSGTVDTADKLRVNVVTTELSRVSSDDFFSRFEQDMERSVPNDLYTVLLKSYYRAYDESKISMIPMYQLPMWDKEVCGDFLCLELGGSTLRVGVVDFSLENVLSLQHSWVLKEDEKVISEQFFDKMVEKCLSVPEVVKLLHEKTNVAITWSFPTDAQGRIITMGKGWQLDDTLKKFSLLDLIQKAFDNVQKTVVVQALVNDSVGTALAGMSHGKLPMSLILGTGVNVCLGKNGQLLNTELGFFGGLTSPTKYDLVLDERWLTFEDAWKKNSHGRIFQPFELITSGRGLCELLRIILYDLAQENVSFPEIRYEEFGLPGELFCLFSTSKSTTSIQNQVSSQFSLLFEPDQIESIQRVVHAMISRSSRFMQKALLAMYEFSTGQRPTLQTPITVSYTGSFLHHCELYQRQITHNSGIELAFIAESSLIGAAVAASL